MQQIKFAPYLLIVALTFGCSPLRFTTLPIVQEGDWITDGGNYYRTNSDNSSALQPPLSKEWTYNATAGFSDSSPLLIDGNIYLGNRKGEVHVVRAIDGRRVAIQGFGNSIEAAPIHFNGQLIVANAWGKTALKSYNLVRGMQNWSYKGPPIEGGLVGLDGAIVTSDIEGKVFSLNAVDGEENWSFFPDSVAGYYSAPVLVNNKVFMADSDGVIRAFNPETGELLFSGKHGHAVYSNIVASKSRLFVSGYGGKFSAYNVDGLEHIWSFNGGSPDVKFAQSSLVDGLLVVGSTDGFLRAFRPNSGKLLWETRFDGAITSAPLIMKDYISIGTMARELYLVDRKTGETVWNERLRGRIKSAQMVAGETLIVMSEPKYVYGFSMTDTIDATN